MSTQRTRKWGGGKTANVFSQSFESLLNQNQRPPDFDSYSDVGNLFTEIDRVAYQGGGSMMVPPEQQEHRPELGAGHLYPAGRCECGGRF